MSAQTYWRPQTGAEQPSAGDVVLRVEDAPLLRQLAATDPRPSTQATIATWLDALAHYGTIVVRRDQMRAD